MTCITATPAHWASRTKLLISCASLAIATAGLFPQKAQAQAFQGTIGSTSGSSVTRTNTSGTSETITVGGNATINWSPTDVATGTAAAIDFLPAGNTATYTSSSGVVDYTVLNRIVPVDPSRPIALNGTVVATLQGTSAIGGNVWFYSPGGILVGANALFNVGGLLLTTADPGAGWSADANGFSGSFATSDPNSKVSIASGAQINALQQNSYVAVIAPRVEQGGTVKVDGSAAYVAANSLTMTMNQGLFDIEVDVGGGTDDPNGVVHTGSTTSGDTAALSATHKIYIVAVPKNLALTMLLGGTIGFDANTVGYDNGQIVLSAGLRINDTGSGFALWSEPGANASIDFGPGNYLSNVFGYAIGDITAVADTGNPGLRRQRHARQHQLGQHWERHPRRD
jgi:filamentous hemagglutinin family protein